MTTVDAETYIKSRIDSGALTYAQIVQLVRAFQLQNSLIVDGKLGPATLCKVDVLLARPEPPMPPPLPATDDLPNLALDPLDWLYGIDIDHHQQLRCVSPDVAQFAYVGVTEGTTSVDAEYQKHLLKLAANGVKALGVYHFARPSSARLHGPEFGQPLGEAEHFARQWEIATKIVGKTLPPVLDMEDEKEKLSVEELVNWTLKWCEHCERLTGRRPIIYTYFGFIRAQLKGCVDELSKYSLWLADYRVEPPSRPSGIQDWPWLFWQFTGTGKVRGIDGDCDRNVFRGTRAQLDGLLL